MGTNKFNKRTTLTQFANVLLPDRLHSFNYVRGLDPTLTYQFSTIEQNQSAFKFSTTENLQATFRFMQVGLDEQAINDLQIPALVTADENLSAFYITSTIYCLVLK